MNKPSKMIKHNSERYFAATSIVWNGSSWTFENGNNILEWFLHLNEKYSECDTTGFGDCIPYISEVQNHWVKDIIKFWMDEFAERVIAAMWCRTFEETQGNEKAKFRVADSIAEKFETEVFR